MMTRPQVEPDGQNAAVKPVSYGMLLFMGLAGFSLLQFPRDAAVPGNGNGVLSIILAALVAGLSAWLSVRATSLRPGHAGDASASRRVLAGLMVVFHLALAAVVMRELVLVTRTFFLPVTSTVWIVLPLTLLAAWAASDGLTILAWTVPLVLSLAGLVMVPAGAAGLSNIYYWWAMTPVFAGPLPVVQGAFDVLYVFLGLQSAVNMVPLTRQDGRGTQTALWWCVAAGIFVLVCLQLGVAATFSPPGMQQYTWPVVSAVRIIDIGHFFIARIGAFALAGWTALAFGFLMVRLWSAGMELRALLGDAGVEGGTWVWGAAAVVFALAAWPSTGQQLQVVLYQVIDPLGLVVLVAQPVLLWLN